MQWHYEATDRAGALSTYLIRETGRGRPWKLFHVEADRNLGSFLTADAASEALLARLAAKGQSITHTVVKD